MSSSKSDVCIGDDIDLYCHYPITAGNCRSSQSQPDFHVNGTLISVTRVIENCPHDFSGSGDTSISFCIKWNVEKGGHSNLTCSNTYGECISIESKGLLIDPIGECEYIIELYTYYHNNLLLYLMCQHMKNAVFLLTTIIH